MGRTVSNIVARATLAVVLGQCPAASAQADAESRAAETSETPGGKQEVRRLSDAGELQRIISLYNGGKYEECTHDVAHLLDKKNDQRLTNPQVVEQARLYHATCLVMSGRENEAIAPLRAVLSENPTLGTPDSLTFPPPLISLFLQVRKEFADAIRAEEEKRLKALELSAERTRAKERAERQRVTALEKLATTETVLERRSRYVASLPFGAGQFQNENKALGVVFLASEALLLGTSVVAGVAVVTDQYSHLGPRVFNSDITENVRAAKRVSIVTFYGFLGVAAIGIAEAHINFVPEVRFERKRELPVKLRAPKNSEKKAAAWLPWVEPLAGGLSAGVVGVF